MISLDAGLSRRALLTAVGFLLPGYRLSGATPTERSRDRNYRADATVTFLGIPIVSRSAVGSGSIRIEEKPAQDGGHAVALRFMAGSTPERARGLNRLGYIQESVVERNAVPSESTYFGFITTSKEQNLDQAKGALGPAGDNPVPYAAVEGGASGKSASYTLYHTVLPNSYTYSQCEEIVSRVKTVLARHEIQPTRRETHNSESPQTFLYALLRATRAESNRMDLPFLYNGKSYRLRCEKTKDEGFAKQFASRKLPVSANIFRLNGTVYNLATRESTPFRMWFEPGQDLPVRFEYKPRSFLQLAFEWTGR